MSLKDAKAIAIGILGLSLEDADKCSIEDITHAMAWRRVDSRQHWEMTQMLAFYMVQPYDSKNKIKQPTDLFEMPWQKSEESDPFSPESIEARKKRFEKWDKLMLEKANG